MRSPLRKRTSEDHPTATVLCYHIVEAPAAPRMHIGRDTFRQHLRYLEMTGYNVIPLRHLYEYVTGKRSALPKNAVVITIDDGWRSTYTEAFPELQKRKFPFTVFIYPNIIGKTSNALSWNQIREMSKAGVDIQSHALTHPYLTRRKHGSMSDDAYAAWLRSELAESRRILEKESGKKVQFLAYPYGDYDGHVAAAADKAGYLAALTCDFGRVKKGSDPLKMRRFVIDDKMDFAAFRKYLGATPMQLAEMSPEARHRPRPRHHHDLREDPRLPVARPEVRRHGPPQPRRHHTLLLRRPQRRDHAHAPRRPQHPQVANTTAPWSGPRTAKTGKRVEATWVFRLPDPDKPAEAEKALPAVTPAKVIASTVAVPAAHTGGSPKR